MKNLKFLLQNVTESHYLSNLNSQLWVCAERGAAKTTPGLNPGVSMPMGMFDFQFCRSILWVTYLFDTGINLREKHRNDALLKEFGTFGVP